MKRLKYILLVCFPVTVAAQGYTLEQCIDMALGNNYDLKNSRLDYDMAIQTKKEAFTKYFPSVSAGGVAFDATQYLVDDALDMSAFGQIFAGLGIDPVAAGVPTSFPIQMVKDGVVGVVAATQPIFAGGQIILGNQLARVGRDVSELKIALSESEVRTKTEEYF